MILIVVALTKASLREDGTTDNLVVHVVVFAHLSEPKKFPWLGSP